MKILITGAAGFIGFHLCKVFINLGYEVVGLDNINDYYDVNLKFARLKKLGINEDEASVFHDLVESNSSFQKAFKFIRMNLEDKESLTKLFNNQKFDKVCNLAAQVGTRNSIENLDAYIQSNIVGFLNILECCRVYKIKHFIYASSSSVYGTLKKVPFKTSDNVDSPVSLYAATKKSNELMAHTYSHLYNLQTTGLRFFTVYGPWGRPDMAPMLFANAVFENHPIKVFNYGEMERDFTYIDDVVESVKRVVERSYFTKNSYSIYNIGNNKPIRSLDFIACIEKNIGKETVKEMLPIQSGDMEKTWANVDCFKKDYSYSPKTNINIGVSIFIEWFKNEYLTLLN